MLPRSSLFNSNRKEINLSTPATPPVADTPSGFAKIEEVTKLTERFETLKKETESLLNKMAEDGQKLQDECKKLADQVIDLTKRLNLAIDEIRSIGGKKLEHVDPRPAQDARKGLSVTMFDAFEDDEEK